MRKHHKAILLVSLTILCILGLQVGAAPSFIGKANLIKFDESGRGLLTTKDNQELLKVQLELQSPGWKWWGQSEAISPTTRTKGNLWQVSYKLQDPVTGYFLNVTQSIETIENGYSIQYNLAPQGNMKINRGYLNFLFPCDFEKERFLRLDDTTFPLTLPREEQHIDLEQGKAAKLAEADLLSGVVQLTPEVSNYNWELQSCINTGYGLWLIFGQETELKVGKTYSIGYKIILDQEFNFEGSPEMQSFSVVDLRSVVNMGLADDVEGDQKGGWTDQGDNDLRDFPTGKQEFRGIPFEIIDPETNGGKASLVMYGEEKPYFPKQATIPIGKTAKTFCILHGASWCPSTGTKVADYILEYTDGTKAAIPTIAGEGITNWWWPSDTSKSVVAWKGSNAACGDIGINLYLMQNPYPNKEIKNLVIQTTGKGVLGILGITITDGTPKIAEATPAQTDTTGWIKYQLATNVKPGSALDVSFLLDKPSGKHGFVTTAADQFVFEDGTPIRFWGTVFAFKANFPSHAEAEIIAQRLARSGCNIVRLHHMDWGGYENGHWNLFDSEPGPGGELRLSEERLDKLDYLIYQLKKNGIYVYMDLFVSRGFSEKEGVRDAADFYVVSNPLTLFDPKLIELQKEFAHTFLTHVNPYTGLSYADEPTIAMMEIINETSLIASWSAENLQNWPQYYRDEFFVMWNEWLLARYGTHGALKIAWTDANGDCPLTAEENLAKKNIMWSTSLRGDWQISNAHTSFAPARVSDTIAFLEHVQAKYFQEMEAYLRALGIKVPIAGSNYPNHTADIRSNAGCDYLDNHVYHDHPTSHDPWTIDNSSLVKMDLVGTANILKNLTYLRVSNKPFFVTEWDFVWPNAYLLEGQPIMAAFAAYQDWNGLTRFSYANDSWGAMEEEPAGPLIRPWNFWYDPSVWGQWPASALIYLRGDVKPSDRLIEVAFSDGDVLSGQERFLRDNEWKEKSFLMFEGRLQRSYFDTKYTGNADLVISSGYTTGGDYSEAKRALVYSSNPWTDGFKKEQGQFKLSSHGKLLNPEQGRKTSSQWLQQEYCIAAKQWDWPIRPQPQDGYISDTGELSFYHKKELFTLDTHRSQGAVGVLKEQGTIKLSSVEIESDNTFAAVTIHSLGNEAIATATRLLITAVGRVESKGQLWDSDQRTLIWPGSDYLLMDPVEGTILIKRKDYDSQKVVVYALAADGSRVAEVPTQPQESGFSFEISHDYATMYYEVVIE